LKQSKDRANDELTPFFVGATNGPVATSVLAAKQNIPGNNRITSEAAIERECRISSVNTYFSKGEIDAN